MSKSMHFVVETNNNTGVTLRKVSESPNHGGEEPVFFDTGLVESDQENPEATWNVGFYLGTDILCNRDAKIAMNIALNEKGMRGTSGGMNEDGQWVTTNTHKNGTRVEMTVLGKDMYRFSR